MVRAEAVAFAINPDARRPYSADRRAAAVSQMQLMEVAYPDLLRFVQVAEVAAEASTVVTMLEEAGHRAPERLMLLAHGRHERAVAALEEARGELDQTSGDAGRVLAWYAVLASTAARARPDV